MAVLHAVDDLLVDVGYAAMTMKNIAERAGVGRQTVYRWWSTKAEILFEACVEDAGRELASEPGTTTVSDIANFLAALAEFLSTSPAGAAYRALLGEAQHDPAVAVLLGTVDVLGLGARPVLQRALDRGDLGPGAVGDDAVAVLVGPLVYRALTAATTDAVSLDELAAAAAESLRRLG